MTASCYRLRIRYERIFTGEPFSQHSFKSIVPVAAGIPVQEVPAHLVNHDPNDQFRPVNTRIILLGTGYQHERDQKEGDKDFSHVFD
jgi:hypothetical protein